MRGAIVVAAAMIVAFSYAFAHPGSQASACGAAGPFDFDTYEPENYVTTYNRAIELAAEGKAVTFTPVAGGESVNLLYQGLLSGPRATRTTQANTGLRIPPSIYKSIAWIESIWANASGSVPYGGVGPVLRSSDCGYGIGQVTSGMENATNVATAKQAAIGTHFLFNMAEGARILADKWNGAPRFRPIAGNGDPAALEDWYFAIWSYNGFAGLNHPLYDTGHTTDWGDHPLNPLRDPLRGDVYHCGDPAAATYQATASGAPKFGYGAYTYVERVYGCMRNPPKDRVTGARYYPPQTFVMPNFSIEAVARAFDPKNYLACQAAGFAGGCPSMDFPTTIPDRQVVTHPDSTPPADVSLRAGMLGDPVVQYTGSTDIALKVTTDGVADTARISVRNVGSWIAPFRVRTSAPWLVVRHPDDPDSRTLDGGVAVGRETAVVTQAPLPVDTGLTLQTAVKEADATLFVSSTATLSVGNTLVIDGERIYVSAVVDGTRLTVARARDGTTAAPHAAGAVILKLKARIAQQGYESVLLITVIPELMPSGTSTGTVYIEPLLGGGGTFQVSVTAARGSSTLRYRAVAPDVRSDP